MTTYDDDTIVALLHEAVPAAPERVPDRVATIRVVAGRQRARMWTQSLAAVAVVLVIVGVAAAVGSPGKGRTLQPVGDPMRLMTDALLQQRSVHFDARIEPAGEVTGIPEASRPLLYGHLTGALTVDGEGTVDGTLGLLAPGIEGETSGEDYHFRSVGGSVYRKLSDDERTATGKQWELSGSEDVDAAQVRRLLPLAAMAGDATYLRAETVRGVDVATYHVSVPARLTKGYPVELLVSLDADGLPRRVTVEFGYGLLYGSSIDDLPAEAKNVRIRVTADLFGYGDAVQVSAPPAAEVSDDVVAVPDSVGNDSSSGIAVTMVPISPGP